MKYLKLLFVFLLPLFMAAQEVEDEVYIGDWVEPVSGVFAQDNLGGPCREVRVVVHVVYDSMGGPFLNSEISENQVRSQIRATNQFFANDSLYYDEDNAGINYRVRLAEFDPDGLQTSGIIYHDGVEIFGEDWHTYGVKNSGSGGISQSNLAATIGWGADINGKKYLNSFVVPRIDGNNGGGVQAFAYFPTNNVVYGNYNLYNTFGSKYFEDEYGENFILKTYTNEGKVWSHELLHNFAIFHTFQGNSCEPENNPMIQGDRVADTPPQTKGTSCVGSCDFISYNLMDYLSEHCKNVITQGQSDRVDLVMVASLDKYLVCDDCAAIPDGDFNNDGYVNILDVSMFSTGFGCVQGEPCYESIYDMNCDGGINILDVSIITTLWTTSTSVSNRGAEVDVLGRQTRANESGIYIYKNGKKYVNED